MTQKILSRYFGFDIPDEWENFYARERTLIHDSDNRFARIRAEYRPRSRQSDEISEIKEKVKEAVSMLPDSQKKVVAAWMACGRISEVGRQLGFSKQRASVVFLAALERLRDLLAD